MAVTVSSLHGLKFVLERPSHDPYVGVCGDDAASKIVTCQ